MIYRPLKYMPSQTVILETDIGGDVDDVGALTMLLDGAKKYGYRMGGISLNRIAPHIVEGVRALLCKHGFENLPIATAVSGPESSSSYLDAMAAYLPENADLHTVSAFDFYKELFEKAEDASITIVSVGFLQNLDKVWRRDPGLFEKKVRAVIVMGGSFLCDPDYREYNFTGENHSEETADFIKEFPGQAIYVGWEAGDKVWTDVSSKKDVPDPVIAAYGAFGSRPGLFPYKRESWDPVTADFAIHGEGVYYRLSSNMQIWLMDGKTQIKESPTGKAAFVILNRPEEELSERISKAILDTVK